MKKQFVPTSNYRRFVEALKRLENRGAREAGMMLVSGAPGYGKTNITEGWAAQTGAIFLRANAGWTPTSFQRALAGELKIDSNGRADDLFGRIMQRLAVMGFPAIVLDEVQHCLAERAAVLEKVRDFSDRTQSTVILVAGEEDVLTRIKRFPQIASRIAENVEFQPAALDDVGLIAKQLAEVELKPDLVAAIHAQSAGRLRLVMNAITTVEGLAKTNGLKAIDLAQVREAGVVLCADWQSGRARRAA